MPKPCYILTQEEYAAIKVACSQILHVIDNAGWDIPGYVADSIDTNVVRILEAVDGPVDGEGHL